MQGCAVLKNAKTRCV